MILFPAAPLAIAGHALVAGRGQWQVVLRLDRGGRSRSVWQQLKCSDAGLQRARGGSCGLRRWAVQVAGGAAQQSGERHRHRRREQHVTHAACATARAAGRLSWRVQEEAPWLETKPSLALRGRVDGVEAEAGS